MTTAKDIIEHARTYLGIPFRHQGRNHTGIDCAGLVVGVANHFRIPIYSRNDYERDPHQMMMKKALDSCMDRIGVDTPGCVLFMRFNVEPQHLAILTDKNTIIHAYSKVMKCVEHRYNDQWKRRVVARYWYKGVEPWRG